MKVLEFAINMELEGEKHYIEQAELNKGNSLEKLFLILAKDEREHATILQQKADKLSYLFKNSDSLVEAKNVFKGIGDFKSEIKDIPDQLELYREALKREKESVELYKKLLSESESEDSKVLFNFLIKQEQEHYDVIHELVSDLLNTEDWVESAEFGIKEEY